MEISIIHLSEKDVEEKGIRAWPVWQKGIGAFDWHYADRESCLILEGEAEITSDDITGTVVIRSGDFVVFPRGLTCRWNIIAPIKKHYEFS